MLAIRSGVRRVLRPFSPRYVLFPQQTIHFDIGEPSVRLKLSGPCYSLQCETQAPGNVAAFGVAYGALYLYPVHVQFAEGQAAKRLHAPCHDAASLVLFAEPIADFGFPVRPVGIFESDQPCETPVGGYRAQQFPPFGRGGEDRLQVGIRIVFSAGFRHERQPATEILPLRIYHPEHCRGIGEFRCAEADALVEPYLFHSSVFLGCIIRRAVLRPAATGSVPARRGRSDGKVPLRFRANSAVRPIRERYRPDCSPRGGRGYRVRTECPTRLARRAAHDGDAPSCGPSPRK